ncbi:hypothetical protein GE061_006931 [Apolygus lucorum]|uniref:Uncharacterized protein n=1 Tax=Apolygus lucorum TaxID=248454 RepID=A0A6A4JAG0_APOLU|nr:hypothetical protein GE061_006931 [Apolygus lucorum]
MLKITGFITIGLLAFMSAELVMNPPPNDVITVERLEQVLSEANVTEKVKSIGNVTQKMIWVPGDEGDSGFFYTVDYVTVDNQNCTASWLDQPYQWTWKDLDIKVGCN